MEQPVTFKNEKSENLFGVVHIPQPSSSVGKKVGVNLLCPGIKYRVAPNRLNVKLARKLCLEGYYVLRFDPAGVGDSEGELPNDVLVHDTWEKIQKGLFVSDTIAANDFFTQNYELDQLALAGSCGGAITSLLTSLEDRRIDALCLIDVPVNLRTASMSFADKVVVGGNKADLLFCEYMKKLFRPQSWYRFITLKTDFRAFLKVLNMKFQKTLFPFHNNTTFAENTEKLCREKGLNKLFFQAFETFVTRKKSILFVLAGNDPGTEIFEHYFQNMYLKERRQNPQCDEIVEIFFVENANHVYTLAEWQESLINKVCSWIGKITLNNC